jgi:hypothetical protein
MNIMKKVALLFCFLVIWEAQAQQAPNHLIYSSIGIGLGTHFGVGLNLNYAIEESFSLQLGWSGYVRASKSTPDDYSPGVFTLFFPESDWIENYSISMGKMFIFRPQGKTRMNLLGGLAFSTIEVPVNWKKTSSGLGTLLGGSYTCDYHKYNKVSVIINPKFEFPVWRIVGFHISPLFVINMDMPIVAMEIGYMVGKLR